MSPTNYRFPFLADSGGEREDNLPVVLEPSPPLRIHTAKEKLRIEFEPFSLLFINWNCSTQ